MRALVVQDQFEDGGAARVASIMCNGLWERGYNIDICTDNIKYEIKYELNPGINVHSVDFSVRVRNALSRFLSVFRIARDLRKYIREINPDVIIAIQCNAYVRTLIANINLKVPLLAADHTSFSRKMDFLNNLTRFHLYKYADGLSILTERDRRLLGTKFPKKRVIYNPLTFSPHDYATQRENTVLVAGRFDIWRIKGFDIILNIWDKLSLKHPNWKLVFAGTGNPESIDYVEQMANHLFVNGRVEFLGQVKNMKELFEHTGIFALPSRVEGFPMVLLEAMSQGCPCVAFNVGGASEEMIQKDCGYVIADGDIEGFSKALDELMSSSDLRTRYSLKSVSSVSKFSIKAHLDAWEEMIQSTIKD